MTSFVGRRGELTEVQSLLARSRLVTLVGVGGVGKTRLALRVAAGLRRGHSGGIWLVELDQVRDESLVAHAVARALGLREQGGPEPVAMLTEYLRDRQLLLVLDNCEHLVCGVAKLAEKLLRDTGELRILATSRQPLNVEGETTHPVAPLAVPDPKQSLPLAELARSESVVLFTERARALLPGLELNPNHLVAVGEICSHLDGLPLAIELAVARLPVLTPEQIRDRLWDRGLLTRGRRAAPRRQQTLRGCIEWSHGLCTWAEQLVWARLSIFAGDFDLAAAEGVCADDRLPDGEVLELVTSLVDQSVLVAQHDHGAVVGYRMLESIRTYGRDQLVELGEEALLRRRHRDWCQSLASRFEAEWIGPGQRDWIRSLDRMLPDIWAALEFSLTEPGQAEAALAMGVDLQMFWAVSGLHRQARRWLGRALSVPGLPTPVRIRALYFDVARATSLGQLPAAAARLDEAHEVAEQLGDAHSHALVTAGEGTLAAAHGDLAGTVRLYEEALEVFRAEADSFWQAVALTNLTLTKVLLGDMSGAATSHQAILAICRPRGESWFCGFTAMSLGIGLWRQGDLDGAATQMTESLQLIHGAGDTMATSWCLEATAWIAADRERPGQAATLLGAAAALAATMGTWPTMWQALLDYHEQCQRQVQHVLGQQAFAVAFEQGHTMPLDDAVAYALHQPREHPRPSRQSGSGPRSGPMSSLTRREREVAAYLAQGLTNKEIAERIVISSRTVEGHVQGILTKLDCTSRAQAAALIVGLPPPQPPAEP